MPANTETHFWQHLVSNGSSKIDDWWKIIWNYRNECVFRGKQFNKLKVIDNVGFHAYGLGLRGRILIFTSQMYSGCQILQHTLKIGVCGSKKVGIGKSNITLCNDCKKC